MSINAETEASFEKIAQLIAIEVSYKLSSLVNQKVNFTYSRMIDPAMSGSQITVKKDSYLLSSAISKPDCGPISLIANAKQVSVIANLARGQEAAADNDSPDEKTQTIFTETIKQVLDSTFVRLNNLKGETILAIAQPEFRFLETAQEASLEKPANIEDPVAFGFKIKIESQLDEPVHIELNSKAIEFIVNEFATIIDDIDLSKLEQKIRLEYPLELVTSQEEEEAQVPEEELSDAQKVNEKRNLKFLTDINLDLIVELGRAEMMMKDILKLTKGSAIELEKACNEPVDLYVHNQLVAKGEVVAIDDCFGLKITELSGNLNLAKQMGLKLSKIAR